MDLELAGHDALVTPKVKPKRPAGDTAGHQPYCGLPGRGGEISYEVGCFRGTTLLDHPAPAPRRWTTFPSSTRAVTITRHCCTPCRGSGCASGSTSAARTSSASSWTGGG